MFASEPGNEPWNAPRENGAKFRRGPGFLKGWGRCGGMFFPNEGRKNGGSAGINVDIWDEKADYLYPPTAHLMELFLRKSGTYYREGYGSFPCGKAKSAVGNNEALPLAA